MYLLKKRIKLYFLNQSLIFIILFVQGKSVKLCDLRVHLHYAFRTLRAHVPLVPRAFRAPKPHLLNAPHSLVLRCVVLYVRGHLSLNCVVLSVLSDPHLPRVLRARSYASGAYPVSCLAYSMYQSRLFFFLFSPFKFFFGGRNLLQLKQTQHVGNTFK